MGCDKLIIPVDCRLLLFFVEMSSFLGYFSSFINLSIFSEHNKFIGSSSIVKPVVFSTYAKVLFYLVVCFPDFDLLSFNFGVLFKR